MQTNAKKKDTQSGRTTRTLPGATYRVQLNKTFRFKDAIRIVPYLAQLGITHLYASPILKARAGSMHGYDIIDHNQLNPEIGSRADFNELVQVLHEHGMGLIVDFVPNHMGVGSDNPWWLDVLENGPASAYAAYFDIDWSPVKRELEGKVLLPVLGESYGNVIESGQLKLAFDPDAGKLSLQYYEHRFPLNPLTYPQVLGLRIDELIRRMGDSDPDLLEFLSILSAFERLPDHLHSVGFSQRIREKTVQFRRLSELCTRNGQIREFIQENVARFTPEQSDVDDILRLHNLLEMQAYRLAFWRVAFDDINYRRFFDVNDLAAIRTEDMRVFDDIHSFTLELVAERKIDGLRIDHPDGLFDPSDYFLRLQMRAAQVLGVDFDPKGAADPHRQSELPLYVVAEKILAPFEQLEEPWLVHGTTGYDYMDTLNNLLVDEEHESEFNDLYEEVSGGAPGFDQQKRDAKRLILETILASELTVLAHRLSMLAESSWFFRDFTLTSLRAALKEIVVQFPVYRTYASSAPASESSRQYIDWAVALAKRSSNVPEAVYEFVSGVLKMDLAPESFGATRRSEVAELQSAFREFAMKFQQFTGPVTAKSVEDTLFYRYSRFVGLNEVGSEPKRFGTSAAAFHHQNVLRQTSRPYGMISTSTHDTKRSEDVRARMAVISEIPTVWRTTVERWRRLNEQKLTVAADERMPDPCDEYFLYQNIVGAWPVAPNPEELAAFKDRMKQYASKAFREAKRHTSWIQSSEQYEAAVAGFIDALLEPGMHNKFFADLSWFADRLSAFGQVNSLVQTALKLTSPGVPDIYQGNEFYDLSLVDPDNRRPVDFEKRAENLQVLAQQVAKSGNIVPTELIQKTLHNDKTGAIKMLVTAALLGARRRAPELFRNADYIPLTVSGSKAQHILAFARKSGKTVSLVVVPLKVAALLDKDHQEKFYEGDVMQELGREHVWGDTFIELPDALSTNNLHNIFGGSTYSLRDTRLPVHPLFKHLPVAVLVPKEILNGDN